MLGNSTKIPFFGGIKFKKVKDTLILSDMHLTIAEFEDPKKPFWKKFNHKEFFIDEQFKTLLQKATTNLKKGIELILAGDIFDFDSVTSIPENPDFKVGWLEKKRGLNSEEPKSAYKIERIIEEHPVFFKALQDFVAEGNKVVFIIGNHDLELHWPLVKKKLINAICKEAEFKEQLRFCNWFYISNSDTLVEHGNQYDPFCSIMHPISPFFKHLKNAFIKLPFGNLTHRYMINGMGVFNPHVDTTFLLSFWGYIRFYLSIFRVQPFLIFSWFFGSMACWIVSVRDGLAPRIKKPFALEEQYQEIARNANAEPSTVRALREIQVHPLSWNVLSIMRVLWLDKAILFVVLFYMAFQTTGFLHFFFGTSLYWTFGIFLLYLPLLFLYSWKLQAVKPEAKSIITTKVLKQSTQIAGVTRLVCGHSHSPEFRVINGIEYINSGYWSPSFKDIKCTTFEKNKSFVWIHPGQNNRHAKLMFWDDCKDKENPFG